MKLCQIIAIDGSGVDSRSSQVQSSEHNQNGSCCLKMPKVDQILAPDVLSPFFRQLCA